MAYIPEWERLPSVLTRVMDGGSCRRQAQTDICTALADGKIGVRPSLELVKLSIVHHEMAHRFAREIMKFVHNLREGINFYPEPWELHRPFYIPEDLQPTHLDWSNSRFKSHWAIQLRLDLAPALLWIVSIKLASADVTDVLLKGGDRTSDCVVPYFKRGGFLIRSSRLIKGGGSWFNIQGCASGRMLGQGTAPSTASCRLRYGRSCHSRV